MLNGKLLKAWFVSLIACILLIALCFRWLDLPVAQVFQHNPGRFGAFGLPSAIIVAGELLVAVILAMVRIVRGRLPESGKVLMVAILASILAFTGNNYVLKLIFGVQQVSEVLFQSGDHGFHILRGSQTSSFPSGHMALAGAFAGVWMRLYPSTMLSFTILLVLGMGLLVSGDWHFVSDVVAGTFLGVTAGLMAGTLWLAHNFRREC